MAYDNNGKYQVITMDGDFPIPEQPNWGIEYDTLAKAIRAAKQQHEDMNGIGNYYTLILVNNENDDVVWLTYNGREYINADAPIAADILGCSDYTYSIDLAIRQSKLITAQTKRIANLERNMTELENQLIIRLKK